MKDFSEFSNSRDEISTVSEEIILIDASNLSSVEDVTDIDPKFKAHTLVEIMATSLKVMGEYESSKS